MIPTPKVHFCPTCLLNYHLYPLWTLSFFNTLRTRRLAVTAVAIGAFSLATPVAASADAIDDVLNALPSGQISCAQAERYWTDEADYNGKVAQANTLALFDSRGPQIKAALARVDEAANRCGLKGGGTTNTGGNTAPAAPAAPAPAPGAPAAVAPTLSLVAPGTPSFTLEVPSLGTVALPDVYRIVAQFLAQFGIRI